MGLTGDGLFIGLLMMGSIFMMFSMKRRNILLAFVTFTVWFAMGMWLFFSNQPPIGFGETWKDILGWGFLIIAFLPWIFQIDVEIRHEMKGHSWTTWGEEPKRTTSEYEHYRDQLFMRTRKRRR